MEKLVLGAVKLGIKLTPKQVEQFHSYYQMLIEWNKKVNLTAITDYEEVQIKHFLDSLTVTLAFSEGWISGDKLIIDIGTGAGFPGIPLKIVFPKPKMVLADSVAKKIDFLNYIIRQLGLEEVETISGRAEELAREPLYREQFSLALCRAVGKLPVLAELALPFCHIGGLVIAQKKGNISQEINRAEEALTTLGGKLRELKKVVLEEFPDERYLVIIEKISPTPQNYPRRPGMPARHPLGIR